MKRDLPGKSINNEILLLEKLTEGVKPFLMTASRRYHRNLSLYGTSIHDDGFDRLSRSRFDVYIKT